MTFLSSLLILLGTSLISTILAADVDVSSSVSLGIKKTGELSSYAAFSAKCTNGLLTFQLPGDQSNARFSLDPVGRGSYTYNTLATAPASNVETINLNILCNFNPVATGSITFQYPTAAPITRCADDHQVFSVVGGTPYSGTLRFQDASLCAGTPTNVRVVTPPNQGELMVQGLSFNYLPPSQAAMVVSEVEVTCGNKCNMKVAFLVSKAPAVMPTITPAPPTVPPTIPTCQLGFQSFTGVVVGQPFAGTFQYKEQCSSMTAQLKTPPAAGQLGMGTGTSFIYAAPLQQGPQVVEVGLQCGQVDVCTLKAAFFVILPTDAPTTTTTTVLPTEAPVVTTPVPPPTTQAPPRLCENGFQIYNNINAKTLFAATLDVPATCQQPTLSVRTAPTSGQFLLPSSGINFYFSAPEGQGYFTGVFDVQCADTSASCQVKVAFQVIVPTEAPKPTTSSPLTNPPTVPNCVNAEQQFSPVVVGSSSSGVINPGQEVKCAVDGEIPTASLAFPNQGDITFAALQFIFTAPDSVMWQRGGYIMIYAKISCPTGGTICKTNLGFPIVPRTAAPQPTTAIPTSPPTFTPAAALPDCSLTQNKYSTAVRSTVTGGLTVTDTMLNSCAAVSFALLSPSSLQNLQFNMRGEFAFTGGEKEALDVLQVQVSCLTKPVCNVLVAFETYQPLTTQAPAVTTTASPPTAGPQPTTVPKGVTCPNVYYYDAYPGIVLSGTLRNQVGQALCAYGRSFSLESKATLGDLTLFSNGDFSYATPLEQTWDTFTFQMRCLDKVVCSGSAYVLISNANTQVPVPQPPQPTQPTSPSGRTTSAPGDTANPSGFFQTEYQTCRGTCNADAWKSLPNEPTVWDDTTDLQGGYSHIQPRQDGKSMNGLDVQWKDSHLIVSVYGKIGNVATRFPTFESLTWQYGDSFTPDDVEKQIAPLSPGFNETCLNQQATWGLAEEVWKWHSIVNKTGGVGKRYKDGLSWYHKFGGKHIGCDTFAKDSCRYAPLLTPRQEQDAKKGAVWSVDINNCDVTWTGSMSYAALQNQISASGSPIWKIRNGNRLSSTLYSEAVKPKSWLDPTKGYASETRAYPLSLALSPWIKVIKLDEQSSPFMVDAEFFVFRDASSNFAWGLNMLFYPQTVTNNRKINADRHVRGFRVMKQEWSNPDEQQCQPCTNEGMKCEVDRSVSGESDFTASQIQRMKCDGKETALPRFTLSKGPAMTGESECATSAFHVYGRRGFSQPQHCSTKFQNLTLRGMLDGSGKGALTNYALEGSLTIQLLLDNGNRPMFTIKFEQYVSLLATDGEFNGVTSVCRSSPYFPVLDPLGTSLPDAQDWRKRRTSENEEVDGLPSASRQNEKESYLCVDNFDVDFGPTGWAVLGFNVLNVDRAFVKAEVIVIRADFIPMDIYLMGQVPNGAVFWQDEYPFLNFRDITYRLSNNDSITSPKDEVGKEVRNSDVAMAFTPGAFNRVGDIEVSCVVRIVNSDGTVVGRVTLRQKLHVDPKLTAESRYGSPKVSGEAFIGTDEGSMFFAAVLAGLTVGVIAIGVFALAADNDRPLPKWIPRPEVFPQTILSISRKPLAMLGVGKKKMHHHKNREGAPE